MGSRELFLLSLAWVTICSRSVTPNSENFRKSRQLDFGECCPCPKPEDVTSDQLSFHPDMPSPDDCPCINRDPELETASSILSPALQVLRPIISPNIMKKEPEPLLKPEVGLASSVLETLQEVTNEEYEDALARDAVRSVARALETDLPLIQSSDLPGNIINIILNQKETGNDMEVVPEASHVQETRCIHSPLGTASNYEANKLKSSLFLEPRRNLQALKSRANSRIHFSDMDNAGSNVQNSLQKPSNGYVMRNLLENDPLGERFGDRTSNSDTSKTKVPDLKLSTFVDNIKKSIQSNPILKQLKNPKNNINFNENDKAFPISATFTEKTGLTERFKNSLKPLILKNTDKPTKLRNLLKLKDVELIPLQNINNNKQTKNIESAERRQTDNDILMNASVNEDDNIKNTKECLKTKNFDAVPSSSNIKNAKTKLESSDFLQSSYILNNRANANSLSKISSDIATTTTMANLIEKSNQNHLIGYDNTPVTEETSLEVESNEQHIKLFNHTLISEETETRTGFQNESLLNMNINSNRTQNIKKSHNNIPLIRADIIKNFQNFKKVNDDMQEKLKQNLQTVLQVVDTDHKSTVNGKNNVQHTKELNNQKLNSNERENNEQSVAIDDLQKMSDSILNMSNKKDKDLFTTASNQELTQNVKPFEEKSEDHIYEDTENDSSKSFRIEKNPDESSKEKVIKSMPLLSKSIELVDSSISQLGYLCNNSENSNVVSSNHNNINQIEFDTDHSNNGTRSLNDTTLKYTEDRTLNKNYYNNLLVQSKQVKDSRDINHEMHETDLSTANLLTSLNDTNGAKGRDEPGCIDIKNNDMRGQGGEPIIKTRVPSLQAHSSQATNSNETDRRDIDSNDMSVQASEPITSHAFTLRTDSSQAISSNEAACRDIHSNEMSIQASEPIVNRAHFVQIDKNQQRHAQNMKPKLSLQSSLKPFSAKITSPNTLDRDPLNHISSNKHQYDHLQKILKKMDKTSPLEKNTQDLVSDLLNRFELNSDSLKSRRPMFLNNLNNGIGMDKNINRKHSNDLYQDVLKNTEDFREYFSNAHNKINDKLNELKMDWNERIKSISERTDNLERSKFNRPANGGKIKPLNSQMQTPNLILNKKRKNTKLTLGRSEPSVNFFSQETLKPLKLSKFSSYENSNLLGERKSSLSSLTTTKRPFPIFSLSNFQKKGMLLDLASKPPQAIKKTMELRLANPSNIKRTDSKTLSSNIDPVLIKKHSIVQRPRSQSYDIIEKEHESSCSEDNNNDLPKRTNSVLSSSRRDAATNTDTPLQLKPEDYSLLSKLIERARSSQLFSNTIRNSNDHGYRENLQSSSHNIEKTKMAENILKENTSYKCKMICTKDEK